MEITAVDYVQEVNKAGEDIWVVLHLYKTGWVLVGMVWCGMVYGMVWQGNGMSLGV
jgi:hypothetical protein